MRVYSPFGPGDPLIEQSADQNAMKAVPSEPPRSFWAHEIPPLTGSGPGMALHHRAAGAVETALAALLHPHDASCLDELAVALTEISALITDSSHPALARAIEQAGLQLPVAVTDKPMLASPSRHDVVLLVSALSALITYGAVMHATPEAATKSELDDGAQQIPSESQFRRQIAELRRTLQGRINTEGEEHAVTPRFQSMAYAIISKEQQLQRMKEVLKSQREANAESLDKVRKQMNAMKGKPNMNPDVVKGLRRMEDDHVKAAQRWEYKRQCLQQERTRLMELAMEAVCKVFWTPERTPTNHTLLREASGQ